MKPRPAILFTLCYGAGLATGLLHFGARVGALVLLGAAVRKPAAACRCSSPPRRRWAAPSGELAWVAERDRCAARLLPGRVRLAIRLAEPVAVEGGRRAGEPVARRLHRRGRRAWPAGVPVAAGHTSKVEARAGCRDPGPRGGRVACWW